ncbi:hypothetical protein PV08_11449 [Exophiala spinifera]|uniref:FAD-binding domain-containing protein n=1 Tax=Exophiala spinifera TaxID=91928 RepID=A0A0D2AVP1_9EURO|nr:uncharacterized protein PV08_11449 [Exophiala spinifera]KIW10485.1 hypothetical protein PV08_11449 [Exophiala spinifera]
MLESVDTTNPGQRPNSFAGHEHDPYSLDISVLIVGVKSLVVERYPERLGAPKAHALSPRSLEICRQSRLDGAKIRQLGTQRRDAYWVNFVTNLSGQPIGALPYERMDAEVFQHTPEMIHNIPQPAFEQYMTDVLAKDSNVEIRRGISFVSLRQDSHAVSTTVEDRTTGHQFQIRSKYVIACDGARSKVRACLKIESDGEDSYETMMTIHFNANLRPIVGDRVGMLHWIFDPVASGFIIAYDLSGNLVLISNFDATKQPVESWNEDVCRQTVTSAIGKDISFDILSYRPWVLSRKVARSYRQGNVFLAGDAAHSFPPTGGLGLNSGLGDVHNLAYKIALVLNGEASERLLDSYEGERRHVAVVNSMQSVKNGRKIFGLLKTLGIGQDTAQARRNLYASLSDPDKKREIDEGIEEQREHFDNLELHIGYVYGDRSIPPHASKYVPKFTVGARLPHAWIRLLPQSQRTTPTLAPVDVSYIDEFSEEDIRLRQYSTLDLCDMDKFTLLGNLDVPGVKTFRPGRDFEVVGPGAGEWLDSSRLPEGGGLLVRPDQHILMVLDADTTAHDVQLVLKKYLCGR